MDRTRDRLYSDSIGVNICASVKSGSPQEEPDMADTCNWPGASGQTYQYHVYAFGTALKAEPGNYIYAKLNSQNQWVPLYIGKTDDLENRVSNHEKRECVRRNGGTHIHAHLTPGERSIRLAEETDLRTNFTTSCNEQ
jgi:predicted GIY-YIG superfamily endonuclease